MSFDLRRMMPRVCATHLGVTLLLGFFLFLGVGSAQEADESPNSAKSAFGSQTESRAIDKIREAWESGRPIQNAGDPVVEGAIQLMREQGSILDGSSLDPKVDAVPADDPTSDRHAANLVRRRTDRTRVAELLLKTSRLLEQVEPVDETRQDLVNKMRRETVRLLSK